MLSLPTSTATPLHFKLNRPKSSISSSLSPPSSRRSPPPPLDPSSLLSIRHSTPPWRGLHRNRLNCDDADSDAARMGCTGSTLVKGEEEPTKKLQKPKPWKYSQPLTSEQLRQMREEFWDTAPHYGGQKEIWDALRAAAEADISLAQAIVDSAGIIVSYSDMTVCYDERGAKYELPKYVLSEPSNLVRDS